MKRRFIIILAFVLALGTTFPAQAAEAELAPNFSVIATPDPSAIQEIASIGEEIKNKKAELDELQQEYDKKLENEKTRNDYLIQMVNELADMDNIDVTSIISQEEYEVLVRRFEYYSEEYQQDRQAFYEELETNEEDTESTLSTPDTSQDFLEYPTLLSSNLDDEITKLEGLIENIDSLIEEGDQIISAAESTKSLVTTANSISSNESIAKPTKEDLKPLNEKVVDYALEYVGNEYVWGGTSLENGADCSGFVMKIYEHFGYEIPRTTGAQWAWAIDNGKVIPEDQAQAGDLVLYDGHVAMLTGNGNEIVHASNSAPYPRGGIKITEDYHYRTILGIVRVIN